jgi:hypothetical protein
MRQQQQQQYEVESLGPIIFEIEKRQERLKAIRPRVANQDRKNLDLRMEALEQSRLILARACKSAPKMSAYFAGALEPTREATEE